MNSIDILHAITRALHEKFPDWEIYTDKLKQEVKEPCFFVKAVYNKRSRYPCNRWKYETNWLIQLLCESKTNHEKNTIGEELHDTLEVITLDAENGVFLRGTNSNFNIYEWCINFSIDYNGFFTRREEAETMESLTIDNTIQ